MKIGNWAFYKYKNNPLKYRNWSVILLHSIFHFFFLTTSLLKLLPYVFHLLVRSSSFLLVFVLIFFEIFIFAYCDFLIWLKITVKISVYCNLCLFWVLCSWRKWKIFSLLFEFEVKNSQFWILTLWRNSVNLLQFFVNC